ncbi:thioesterase domain protein [Myxococcus hansupus]|uniref:Thioesterase domain protein n=1 Tax=Pseudomyxococcus hansupus TaxID=1297742 RepID=A0A0H4XEJ6_9BACT|nr:alpha/beta fold hydrolase [Myxococcus hansupus]AKQ66527.1 thioesterase domain protein [Myxococcus hansupus]
MHSASHSSPQAPDRWFPTRKPLTDPRVRLFCFPFAGGSVAIYNTWAQGLPAGVELCPVQLPGRERRLSEKPIDNLPALLDALLPALAPLLDRPFAFFGYSMGARISLELARRLQARNGPRPLGLFLGAAGPPVINTREPIHLLPEPQFIEALRRYDGTPEEIFKHRELLELVLPMLRADFAIAFTENGAQPAKLSVPLSVIGSPEDKHVPTENLERWRDETTSEDVRVRLFPGGHFFIKSQRDAILANVREDLARWTGTAA